MYLDENPRGSASHQGRKRPELRRRIWSALILAFLMPPFPRNFLKGSPTGGDGNNYIYFLATEIASVAVIDIKLFTKCDRVKEIGKEEQIGTLDMLLNL